MKRYFFRQDQVAIIRARCPELAETMDRQDWTNNPPYRDLAITVARDKFSEGSDDTIEIDDDASLSPDEQEHRGVWVQGWLWVYHSEITAQDPHGTLAELREFNRRLDGETDEAA